MHSIAPSPLRFSASGALLAAAFVIAICPAISDAVSFPEDRTFFMGCTLGTLNRVCSEIRIQTETPSSSPDTGADWCGT